MVKSARLNCFCRILKAKMMERYCSMLPDPLISFATSDVESIAGGNKIAVEANLYVSVRVVTPVPTGLCT